MNKKISWGISGDQKRTFVSPSYGCGYNCQYCYLNEVGIQGIQYSFSAEELLNGLNKSDFFLPGKNGSIVTIGCYTESMDEINRPVTVDVILAILQQGNYIQVSTKKAIAESDLKLISSNMLYRDQMNFFISLPTLSYAEKLEPGMDSVEKRLHNFELMAKYGLNAYLYIKPVITNITVKDLKNYAVIVKKYHIPVVIGERLSPSWNTEKGFIMGNLCMQERPNDDTEKIRKELGKYTRIYQHSLDVLEELRKNGGVQGESTNK